MGPEYMAVTVAAAGSVAGGAWALLKYVKRSVLERLADHEKLDEARFEATDKVLMEIKDDVKFLVRRAL